MTASIRRARRQDARALTSLAQLAKQHWGYPEDWLRLWRPALTITPRFIVSHPVYSMQGDNEALGFYALSQRGARFDLEHLWVHPQRLRSGLGTRLFRHAVATARRRHGRLLTIASDPNAEGFYRRCGARRVGEVDSVPAGRRLPVLHVRLGRAPKRTGRRPPRTTRAHSR